MKPRNWTQLQHVWEMEDDKGSGGSQKIKTICWKVFCETSGEGEGGGGGGGKKSAQSAGVKHQKESKQNRNYIR